MNDEKYDYLIVGTGLFGSVFAHEVMKHGKSCLVIDKRKHIGGNIYTENRSGINVHIYGAHIFHTSDKMIWQYINQFAEFNNYINSPMAEYKGKLYNLPFNMNTFYELWGVKTPAEAKEKIKEQTSKYIGVSPENLEQQALSLAGDDIYEKLIKGYTEKQWGRECSKLPAFIIKRLPFRFTFNNNYFNDRYQGIPVGGYTQIISKLLGGADIMLETNYFEFIKQYPDIAKKTVFTGMIDEFYNNVFGHLQYRSVSFDTQKLETENYQGNAVINYTEKNVPYTRIIEHKHFENCNSKETIISKEYPCEWKPGIEPYYPVNDDENSMLYKKYRDLAKKENNIIFGGRLGSYQYYDMDKVIKAALVAAKSENLS